MKKLLLGILGFIIFFFFAFTSGIYSAHVFDMRPSFQAFMVFTFIFGFFGGVLFSSYCWKKTGLGNFARSVRKKINMSDILLTFPSPTSTSPQQNPALSIFYPGAALEREGHNVLYWDERWDSDRDLSDKIDKVDYVGTSSLTGEQLKGVKRILTIAKERGKVTVFGGIHASLTPFESIREDYIDYIVVGEGEKTIVSLAKAVEKNDDTLLNEIKSFAFRDKDQKVKFNLQRDFVENLDNLPMPAWDLIDMNEFGMKLDNYYNPRNLPLKFKSALFSSRACPLDCNFCDMFLVMGKKHRKRSVKTIVAEMEMLKKDFGVNYFSFMDDQLTLNRGHILELCDEIIKRNLNIQFDTPNGLWINSLREEVIAKMAEAGLVSATLAIEHGDEYMRNEVIGKKLEKKKIFEVAALIKKYKIMSSGLFILGFPEDTNETLQQTYDMMHELQLDKMTSTTLIPFPGTALYKQVIKDNLLVHNWNIDELWKTPISHAQGEILIKPYNLTIDELYKWREKFDNIRYQYWKTNPKRDANVGKSRYKKV